MRLGRALLVCVAMVVASTIGVGRAAPVAAAPALYLPFAAGTSHQVTQGNNGPTSHFGTYGTYAIDFSMSNNTSVRASAPGTIESARGGCAPYTRNDGCNGGLGNVLEVRHASGFCTQYAHLSSFTKTSGTVVQGEQIALSGNSGWSTGPHLDFRRTDCNTYSQPFNFVEYTGSYQHSSINGLVLTSQNGSTAPIADGDFVVVSGKPEVFVIAGGAPLYVSSWSRVGGEKPTRTISQAQFNALRTYPKDGTFVGASPGGHVFRFAGGAPTYVSSYDRVGGPPAQVIGIDKAALDNAGKGYPWNHVREFPADGTFVSASPGGQVFRFAGGAPIYVSAWDRVGGPSGVTVVDRSAIDNAGGGYPWNRVLRYPKDGTFVVASPGGHVFRFAGGAPVYVSNYANVGGAPPASSITGIDKAAIDNASAGYPWNQIRKFPADGTFVMSPGGSAYVFVGGAPLPFTSWSIYGNPARTVVDVASLNSGRTDYPFSRVRQTPADGTFVTAHSTGHVYRFAGGAPIYVSAWPNVGGQQSTRKVDSAVIDRAGGTGGWSHVRKYPADGTILRSGPSGLYYEVRSGIPTSRPAASAAVVVDPFTIDNAGGSPPFDNLRAAPGGPGPVPAGSFGALTPGRLLETRVGPNLETVDGQFEGVGRRTAGQVTEVVVANRAGVPVDAGAVAVNLTVVNPSARGYATLWPCGVDQPTTSSLNYVAGQTVANSAVVKVGAGGKVCIYTRQATDIVLDTTGYFPSGSFGALTPGRLLESRVGPNLETVDGDFEGVGRRTAGQVTEVVVTNRAGVPVDAGAVAVNVTVINPSARGYATLWPCGVDQPTTSSLNYVAGQTVANSAVVKVGAGGKVCIYTRQATDVVLDTTGFFPKGLFGALTPGRLFESRSGSGFDTVDGKFEGVGRRVAGEVTEVTVTGRAGVPVGAGAVAVNLTVINPSTRGHATLWPCGVDRPTTSSLNYTAGQTVANSAIVKVGDAGKVCVYTSRATDVVIDTTGHLN